MQSAAGVIVGNNNRGCPVCNRVGKDLSGVHLGLVHEPHGNYPCVNDFIGTVQGNTDKVLLFAVCIMADQWKDIRR